MRYPHTYSLLVLTGLFLLFALSGCGERASLRVNLKDPVLAEIPASIVTVEPDNLPLPKAEPEAAPEDAENAEPVQTEDGPSEAEQKQEAEPIPEPIIEPEPETTEAVAEPETPLIIEDLLAEVYFALDDYTSSHCPCAT